MTRMAQVSFLVAALLSQRYGTPGPAIAGEVIGDQD